MFAFFLRFHRDMVKRFFIYYLMMKLTRHLFYFVTKTGKRFILSRNQFPTLCLKQSLDSDENAGEGGEKRVVLICF